MSTNFCTLTIILFYYVAILSRINVTVSADIQDGFYCMEVKQYFNSLAKRWLIQFFICAENNMFNLKITVNFVSAEDMIQEKNLKLFHRKRNIWIEILFLNIFK